MLLLFKHNYKSSNMQRLSKIGLLFIHKIVARYKQKFSKLQKQKSIKKFLKRIKKSLMNCNFHAKNFKYKLWGLNLLKTNFFHLRINNKLDNIFNKDWVLKPSSISILFNTFNLNVRVFIICVHFFVIQGNFILL